MSLSNLKKELESILLITKWSPSDKDLQLIASRLRKLQGMPTKNSVGQVVLEIVGSYESIALEGIDNSDLTTLLLLATKTD
jgi:hypothetical protein